MKCEAVQLSKIIKTLESGSRPKGGAVSSGVPSLGAEHLDGSGGFNFDKVKYVPESHFAKMTSGKISAFDVLIVKDGATTGKVSIVREDFPFDEACINEHVFLIRLDQEKCSARFCFHYLSSTQGQKELMSDFRGATVGGISRNILNLINVPLPPLHIQEQIADTLDKADALRRKDQELLQKYDELAQAIFYDMFGDPKSGKGKWIHEPLSNLITPEEKISYGIVQPGEDIENGVPVIRVGDFTRLGLKETGFKKVDPEIEKQFRRTRIIGDEILIACVGSIGKIALVSPKHVGFNIVRATARVRPDNRKILREYLARFLSLPSTQNYFQKETRTVSQPTLNISHIENCMVMVPPISLQQEFVEAVKCIEHQINRLQESQLCSIQIFESLSNEFFA